jgi:hypothetical protein
LLCLFFGTAITTAGERDAAETSPSLRKPRQVKRCELRATEQCFLAQ